MSIQSIFNIGTSGLMNAQNQLRIVSDNISNVNTPGYIRKVGSQQAQVFSGKGAGVNSGQVTLATNKYLQSAALTATASSAQAQAFHQLFDQIQSQFGDLTDDASLFNLGSTVLGSLTRATENASSPAMRQEILGNLQSFIGEGARISDYIQSVRNTAEGEIASVVEKINALAQNIDDLNSPIARAFAGGTDGTGAQNAQANYIDELSQLIDVNVVSNADGSVTVRTPSGAILAGPGAVKLSYNPTRPVDADTVFGAIVATGPNGEMRDFTEHVGSGQLKGLLELRDTDSVAVSDQLSEYMSAFAEQLNAAHNASSAAPPPDSLTGKAMNLTLAEALQGFSGTTHLVVTDQGGLPTRQVEIDFTNGQLTANGVSIAFTAASFVSDINAALSPAGAIDYTDGKLSFTASGTNGVVVADDPADPTTKTGKGFSHYFGLNDLIRSEAPLSYATGLTPASDHGFTAGDTVRFSVKSADGVGMAMVDVAIPAGGSMTDLVNALNHSTSGLGRYGTFSLSADGVLGFKGNGSPAYQLGVAEDHTQRTPGGISLSSFFGLGGAPSARAQTLRVDPHILDNSNHLALAQANLSGSGPVVASSDGSGAALMAAIGSKNINFSRAGYHGGGLSTLNQYASNLAGQVGTVAANAENRMSAAQTVANEARNRLSAYQGVNLDEEVIKLTTFQQAYGASSRLIQAAKDMYDVLLGLV